MMLGTSSFATRPLAASPRKPRPFITQAVSGEYGYAAWSFSRQAKLNAWSWHGVGATTVNAWAGLGTALYMRREDDNLIHVMLPDTFYGEGEASTDSSSVEATTQWLDFGKPGVKKALTGLDFDGKNVTAVDVYVSENGGRTGVLAGSFAVGDADGGWTYNGEVIPAEEVGAATEFMLRFRGDELQEVQINRLTLYFEELKG